MSELIKNMCGLKNMEAVYGNKKKILAKLLDKSRDNMNIKWMIDVRLLLLQHVQQRGSRPPQVPSPQSSLHFFFVVAWRLEFGSINTSSNVAVAGSICTPVISCPLIIPPFPVFLFFSTQPISSEKRVATVVKVAGCVEVDWRQSWRSICGGRRWTGGRDLTA